MKTLKCSEDSIKIIKSPNILPHMFYHTIFILTSPEVLNLSLAGMAYIALLLIIH